MKKYAKALVNLLVAAVIFLCVWFVLPRVLAFFAPFLIGWIIALMASPIVKFFEEKVKLKRKAGSAFVIIAVIGLIVLLIYFLGSVLVREGSGFVKELPGLIAVAQKDFDEIAEHLNSIYDKLPQNIQQGITDFGNELSDLIGSLIGRVSSPTLMAVGNFAKYLPKLLIGVIMTLLSSYFFVAERENILEWFRIHTPEVVRARYLLIKRSMVEAVGGYLKAQLKIEIWMYLLLVAGLWILQVNYVWLIALGIAFLDFLPFFGTGTVMIPWAVIKLLSGDYQMAVGLLIIWGVGQLARQIIQPKIVGDSIGMPPIPTLFLLYMGYRFYGVIGMIVAVPLGLILYSMYKEGVFETTKNSLLLLILGLNRFRKLTPEDLKQDQEEMQEENK